MATLDERQLAELRAIPAADLRPRSIADRWADSETPAAFDVTAAPEQVPDGPVLEDPDPARVPYGASF